MAMDDVHEVEDLITEICGAFATVSGQVLAKVRNTPTKIKRSSHFPSQVINFDLLKWMIHYLEIYLGVYAGRRI